MYPDVQLYIDGAWCGARPARPCRCSIRRPARRSARSPHAEHAPTSTRALAAAERGLQGLAQGARPSTATRSCARRPTSCATAPTPSPSMMTLEQGKPLVEAKLEALAGADIIDWFAEEGAPRLWPRRAGPRRGHLAARRQGAGRPGRRLHALELPDQPGGAQDRRRRSRPAARSSSRGRRRRRRAAPS